MPGADVSLPRSTEPSVGKSAIIAAAAIYGLDQFLEGGIKFTDKDGDTLRRPLRISSTTISSMPQSNRPSPVTPDKVADHEGIDLTTGGGNAVVQAIASGTVKRVTNETNYDDNSCGYRVLIDHGSVALGDGGAISYTLRSSLYCHLSSTSVNVDDVVQAGDQIGVSGSTGGSTGDHLHLQLFTDGTSEVDVGPYGVYFSIITAGSENLASQPEEYEDSIDDV